ncbi:DUF6059 family protein [Streptomyces tirandamycinicus]|uniref:DUF6059 family protein n=1 Tax=Streptomyces tirandamycinicus TaxID=2174846 RepID=UPI00342A9FBB
MTDDSTAPRRAPGRWPASVLLAAKRLIGSAYRALAGFGWIWIGRMPPAEEAGELRGPPPGHPERLRSTPLTSVERALERRLTT